MKAQAHRKAVTIMGAFMIVMGASLMPVQQASALDLNGLLQGLTSGLTGQGSQSTQSNQNANTNNPRGEQSSQQSNREVVQTPVVAQPVPQTPVAPTPTQQVVTSPVVVPTVDTPPTTPPAGDTSDEKAATTAAQAELLPKPTVEYESSKLDSSSASTLYAGAFIVSGAGMFVYGLSMVPTTMAFASRRIA